MMLADGRKHIFQTASNHNNKKSKLMIRLFSCRNFPPISAPPKPNKSSIFRIHSISHFRHFSSTSPNRYLLVFSTARANKASPRGEQGANKGKIYTRLPILRLGLVPRSCSVVWFGYEKTIITHSENPPPPLSS